MLASDFALFLLLVGIGAAVQSITGFAMALIIMGGVTALGVAEISFSAAVVSIISMINAAIALRYTHRFINRRILATLCVGLLPLTLVGVWLLEILSQGFYGWLKLLLGLFIIFAGSILMVRPQPWQRVSGRAALVSSGSVAGILGGLYGAGGPAMAWLMYRQPLELTVVRATLLATFFIATAGRTVIVVASGGLTRDIAMTALASVPVVVVLTMVASHYAPRVPDKLIRRFAFGLLIFLGLLLVGESLRGLG